MTISNMLLTSAPIRQDCAIQIARDWGLVYVAGDENVGNTDDSYILYLSENRLELRALAAGQGTGYGPVFVDFIAGKAQYRRKYGGGSKQLIARAVGIKKGMAPRILDATAGFAQDAFVFACLGCQVTLVERSAVIAALLDDAIKRAAAHAEVGKLVRDNFYLEHAEATHFMCNLNEKDRPDVIFLDPMFPEKSSSALVKKEMRVFREIVGIDADADELLPIALTKARNRVVVKRPEYASWLNGMRPSVEMKSKKHRYDVYFTFNEA